MTSVTELNLMMKLPNYATDRVLEVLGRVDRPLEMMDLVANGAGSQTNVPVALQLLVLRGQVKVETRKLGSSQVFGKFYSLAVQE